jgi:hypothetical protein
MKPRPNLALFLWMLCACGGETPPPPPPPPPPPVPPSPISSAGAATEPTPASSASAAAAPPDAGAPSPAGPAQLTFRPVALPGATAPASLDYIAYEPAHARVWVPVGNTGSVDVYDTQSGSFTRVDGFKTAEREWHGKKRTVGPSAVSVGDGFAYVGDRATSQVCAVDLATLKLGRCVTLPSPTDGVAYVASAKEVWVTTPRADALVVLDASRPAVLRPKATIKLGGAPEGYAVDDAHGRFFTNLEDKNKTVMVDVKTHEPRATWSPGCGADGPRGLAADGGRGLLFVACTDHVVVLDAGHDGAAVATLDTGAGVDNIDWLDPQRLLYVAASKAARLTVARVDDQGRPTVVATGETTAGARNAVADAGGNAYVPDPLDARLLVFAFHP